MLRIKSHYIMVAKQLDIPNEMLGHINLAPDYSNHVIIPVSSLNMMVVKALRYARSISPNVEVFHVETYEGEADKLKKKWQQLNTDIPLVIKQSPYREVIGPLTDYIFSEEQMKMVTALENGKEIVQGELEGPVDVKTGANWEEIIEREIVIKDGVVIAIR
jgi:hypothetical protein